MRILRIPTALLATAPLWAASYYTTRLDDPKAVYLTPANFPVKGDGTADDSDAIQQAINRIQETSNIGVVFVPEGRYRITKTINIWPSIRVIGYGKSRPVFVLGDNSPGYQDTQNEKYMVFFAGGRPGAGRQGGAPGAAPGQVAQGGGRGSVGGEPRDAGAGTFYCAMSNIDIEIGNGNPGAVGLRGKYAQHSYLSHMDFRIGSGLAGIHETGNVIEDVRFIGGRYGIWTSTPSPGWQLTVVDAQFEGQSAASIRDRAANLTMIRPQFNNVPTAIEIEEKAHDNLWIKDGRMEDISGPAIVISLENSARNSINMENVTCRRVAQFAAYRQSGKKLAGPGEMYEVKTFSLGLTYTEMSAVGEFKTHFDAVPLRVMPPPVTSDLIPLPPSETWVNVRDLGAVGDGKTDDTEALKKAVAEHKALYFPTGVYIIGDTITLRPDSVLIGLHPSATRLQLLDRTPAFQGIGNPLPMVLAPKGGSNIMIGLGVYTNGINPRAVGVKWLAGTDSLMNDVRFHGGHGTPQEGGVRTIYNNTNTADMDINRRWDVQYPSLWITDGGGGTFLDIWTPSTFATAGMLISGTTTPGRIYEMSSEHHQRYEVLIRRTSNWEIYAMQTEDERGEGPVCSSMEIQDSSNITLANYHMYRVISAYNPFPYGIKITNSKNIKFRNMHADSNSRVAFDATVWDTTHNVRVGEKEFAWLTVTGHAPTPKPKTVSPVLESGAKVEKLAGGFFNISGGAAHPSGDFYFVDPYRQRIYKWATAERQLSIVRDNALEPVNLAIDKAGNIMVVSSFGSNAVYTFKPEQPDLDITLLKAQNAVERPGKTPVLPAGEWSLNPTRISKPGGHYLSPDGTMFIAAGTEFINDQRSYGVKNSALLRFGLAPAIVGEKAYFADENFVSTWEGVVQADGSIADMKQFVNQGGEYVTVDARGNVYVANGRVFVYSPAGKLIDTIDVPERPIQLVFAGKDKKTLFIAARSGLYAVRTKFGGR
jgi:sugar lactone lactonase YvrE